MMKYLLLTFLLLASCVKQESIKIYTNDNFHLDIPAHIDSDFTEKDKSEIILAINEWNRALNGLIVINVIDVNFTMDNDKIINDYKNRFIFLKVSKKNWDNTDKYGFVDKIGGNIIHIVDDNILPVFLYGITLHEIGHLLGAEHTDSGLMYKYFNIKNTCIDFKTIKQVSEYYKIPLSKLKPC